MKIDIDPLEANFAKLVFLTVNMVDVETVATYETIIKEEITKPLTNFGEMVRKEKLNVNLEPCQSIWLTCLRRLKLNLTPNMRW